VNWDAISKYQVLSELFISAYKDKVNWQLASQYQDLSDSFIRNFDFIVPMDEVGAWSWNVSMNLMKSLYILNVR